MKVPKTMEAFVLEVNKKNDWQNLIKKEVSVPTPSDDEILIKVLACGLNRADIFTRMGMYPIPKNLDYIPGLEACGEVVSIGKKVADFKAGDIVFGITNGGAYAHYCLIHRYHCHKQKHPHSIEECAGMAETLSTAYYNLIVKANLQKGEKVLIHGGTSGVGVAAIQIVKYFGAEVYVTCGSKEKTELSTALGATKAYNYKSPGFWEEMQQDVDKFDVILDIYGGDYVEKHLRLLKNNGRLCIISFIGGSVVDKINLAPVLTRNQTIFGSMTKNMSTQEMQDCQKGVQDFLNNYKFKNVIHSTYNINDYGKAHQELRNYQHAGKIILVNNL